jgi:hypothetical protein
MARKNTGDRLAYGLTVMIFGVLFLLQRTHVLDKIPYASYLVSIGGFCLIAGIVFLSMQAERTSGIVLTVVGAIICSDFFFNWMHSYSNLITPVILIVAALVLILTAKK